jgi:hypothetical protein
MRLRVLPLCLEVTCTARDHEAVRVRLGAPYLAVAAEQLADIRFRSRQAEALEALAGGIETHQRSRSARPARHRRRTRRRVAGCGQAGATRASAAHAGCTAQLAGVPLSAGVRRVAASKDRQRQGVSLGVVPVARPRPSREPSARWRSQISHSRPLEKRAPCPPTSARRAPSRSTPPRRAAPGPAMYWPW